MRHAVRVRTLTWKGALDHGLRAAGQERALGSQGAVTLLAVVELGGTNCVCIAGHGPDNFRAIVGMPTTPPDETLAGVARKSVVKGERVTVRLDHGCKRT